MDASAIPTRRCGRGREARGRAAAFLLAVAGCAVVAGSTFLNFRATGVVQRGGDRRLVTALRASKGGDFDFGEYEAPTASVPVMEAEEEKIEMAPPEAEVFLQKETGDWECSNCGWTYTPLWGNGDIPPGTQFKDVPKKWKCPECGMPKARFLPVTEEIAGFAENQDFGLGFNAMTGGQKGIFIWGGLGVLVVILLSGYAME
eukprot:CAMPEP_0170612658 /NCGR_PEP_ID=MMETSP0224-20130122/23841_1 /TAXON_ID=285029 /ORGANISM="Togula jolla, Strain CCCM 725" /LENGTH=201 /DNA_ID=CAMNT_0010938177 /DNA_START=41 /DNA_END=646 /DNA_ORIENTATION=-